jgi:hypothetical protein
VKELSENEGFDKETKQPPSHAKEVKRDSGEKNKKVSAKQNESSTGSRTPREKKQRRQFKLAPNRG